MACSSGFSFDTHYAARWFAGQFPKTWRFLARAAAWQLLIRQKLSVR